MLSTRKLVLLCFDPKDCLSGKVSVSWDISPVVECEREILLSLCNSHQTDQLPNQSSWGPDSLIGWAGIASPVLNYKHDPIPQRHFQENPQTLPICNMSLFIYIYISEEQLVVVIAPIFFQGCNLEILSFFFKLLPLTNPVAVLSSAV